MHIKCHYMVCKVLMASFTFSYTSSALAVVAPIHIHIHIRRSTECLYAITEIAYVCQKSNVSTKQTYYCRCAAQHNSAQVMCVMCNDYSHARCFAHSRHSFLIQCCFSFSRREPKVEKKSKSRKQRTIPKVMPPARWAACNRRRTLESLFGSVADYIVEANEVVPQGSGL